jgi:hypothetical protein
MGRGVRAAAGSYRAHGHRGRGEDVRSGHGSVGASPVVEDRRPPAGRRRTPGRSVASASVNSSTGERSPSCRMVAAFVRTIVSLPDEAPARPRLRRARTSAARGARLPGALRDRVEIDEDRVDEPARAARSQARPARRRAHLQPGGTPAARHARARRAARRVADDRQALPHPGLRGPSPRELPADHARGSAEGGIGSGASLAQTTLTPCGASTSGSVARLAPTAGRGCVSA